MGVPKQRHRAKDFHLHIGFDSKNKRFLDIEINHFSINKFPIKKLTGKVNLSPDIIELDPLKLLLKHGEVEIDGTYHLAEKFITTSIKGKNLFAEDLFGRHLKGKLQFSSKLKGGFKNFKSKKKKDETSIPQSVIGILSGNLGFKIISGQVKQLGVTAPLFTLISPDNPKKANDKISFDLLSGDFQINAGELTMKNLYLKTPGLKLKAQGLANLNKGILEGNIESFTRENIKTAFSFDGDIQKLRFFVK